MNRTCERCGASFALRKPSSPIRFCSRSCGCLARDKSTYRGTFESGRASWNKGLKDWREGYSHSAETRRRISESQRGERAPNWKGGISPENERQRKTAAYREWRLTVFDRDGYRCVECGDRSREGHRVRLHADHIKPFATHPHLRLVIENGRTLCAPCHRKTPTYGAGSFTGRKAELEVVGDGFQEEN